MEFGVAINKETKGSEQGSHPTQPERLTGGLRRFEAILASRRRCKGNAPPGHNIFPKLATYRAIGGLDNKIFREGKAAADQDQT